MNAKMGSISRRKATDNSKFVLTTTLAVLFGFFVGISFPPISLTKIHIHSSVISPNDTPSSTSQSTVERGHILGKSQNTFEGDVSSISQNTHLGGIVSRKSQDTLEGDNISSKSKSTLEGGNVSSKSQSALEEDDVYSKSQNTFEEGDVSSKSQSALEEDDVSSKSHNTLEGGNDSKIYVATNPRGAELLPPGIVVPESDLYLRRLWGDPSEDLKKKPKYLVTFTVGYDQRENINAAVKKFSDDFTILLFHYDGRVTEWDQFEWSKSAIHVSARRQTKWWYAKRFLHPDIVSSYEYIFIWDEDLGAEHFNAEKYIQLVKKHGLEISQPGLEPNNGLTWQMTKRRGDSEVHKDTEEKPGWCADPHLPPCAAFVEIMAPVFSRDAWRCVWHMIQNDLVHGWGLDFALRRCVEPAHEKIGVVDSEWIVHQVIPSLGNQGQSVNGKAPWEGVRARCRYEWALFRDRFENADNAYLSQINKE